MPDRSGAVLNQPADAAPVAAVVEPLLEWSMTNLRDLPWRKTRDPWHVLVSEVMLQQTQVSRVEPKWHEFIARFPTPAACAAASAGDIIEMWAGLGFNRRAVNLWRAAGEIVERFDGCVPNDVGELRTLSGIGPYTARAVAVFAFEQRVGVVDTNVGRLLARWSGHPLTPSTAQQTADALVPADAWRWNQTLFDFANAQCTKREPDCGSCCIRNVCAYGGSGEDPAAGSAGVSKPQGRFEGSVRQVRGRVLDRLRHGPVALDELKSLGRPGADPGEIGEIVAALTSEGLVTSDGQKLRLP